MEAHRGQSIRNLAAQGLNAIDSGFRILEMSPLMQLDPESNDTYEIVSSRKELHELTHSSKTEAYVPENRYLAMKTSTLNHDRFAGEIANRIAIEDLAPTVPVPPIEYYDTRDNQYQSPFHLSEIVPGISPRGDWNKAELELLGEELGQLIAEIHQLGSWEESGQLVGQGENLPADIIDGEFQKTDQTALRPDCEGKELVLIGETEWNNTLSTHADRLTQEADMARQEIVENDRLLLGDLLEELGGISTCVSLHWKPSVNNVLADKDVLDAEGELINALFGYDQMRSGDPRWDLVRAEYSVARYIEEIQGADEEERLLAFSETLRESYLNSVPHELDSDPRYEVVYWLMNAIHEMAWFNRDTIQDVGDKYTIGRTKSVKDFTSALPERLDEESVPTTPEELIAIAPKGTSEYGANQQ